MTNSGRPVIFYLSQQTCAKTSTNSFDIRITDAHFDSLNVILSTFLPVFFIIKASAERHFSV